MVSALIADGPPARLIEEAIFGHIELVIPRVVIDELERVLCAKLGFTQKRWREAKDLLDLIAPERPSVPDDVDPVTDDPADNEVLAAAVDAQVDVLVSGDRQHLVPVGEHRGVRILTPQALLAELA